MITRILLLSLFTFLVPLLADKLFIDNEKVVMEKAAVKMEKISDELREKTDYKIYISAKETINGQSITKYSQELAKKLEAPYVLITFASVEEQIELVMSEGLEKILDKDDILDDSIIPLFVEHRKDITKSTQYSAGLFNGLSVISDKLALSKGVVLEHSVGNGTETFMDGLGWIIRILLLATLVAMFIAYRKSQKGA
mgnify:CR=1 FL=1|jgi:hypothetical protein